LFEGKGTITSGRTRGTVGAPTISKTPKREGAGCLEKETQNAKSF